MIIRIIIAVVVAAVVAGGALYLNVANTPPLGEQTQRQVPTNRPAARQPSVSTEENEAIGNIRIRP
jgi:flagellar basal body-associated protein FliL